MGIIITKIKRLHRKDKFIWIGSRLKVNTRGFRIELTYRPASRLFTVEIQTRRFRGDAWSYQDGGTPEQVEYLKSLLTQEELAECVAASILHQQPATTTHVMRSAKLSMCDAHGNAIPIHNVQLPTLKGP